MKIEKINDSQIRCYLSGEDLAKRQLKLSELAYGSEKAKRLFRDLMQQAQMRAGQLTLEAIFDRIEQINDCERRLQSTNCEPRLNLENLFIRLQGNKRCPVRA